MSFKSGMNVLSPWNKKGDIRQTVLFHTMNMDGGHIFWSRFSVNTDLIFNPLHPVSLYGKEQQEHSAKLLISTTDLWKKVIQVWNHPIYIE